MSAMKQRYHGGKENIFEIVKEYRKLIRLSSPSDIESGHIIEIMELAVYDTDLDDLINEEDKKYAEENNLLEDDYFHEKSSSNQKLNNRTYLTVVENKNGLDKVQYKNKDGTQKSKNASNMILFSPLVTEYPNEKIKTFNFDIRLAISSFIAGGLLTCFGVGGLYNNFNSVKECLRLYLDGNTLINCPSRCNAMFLQGLTANFTAVFR